MKYALLFLLFSRIGLLTIGGGLAALPLLYEAVVTGGWISDRDFTDMLAISQSTPGPVGINMATFAGYKAGGVPGALAATAGMAAPSMVIIMLIARFMTDYEQRPAIRHVLAALRPAAIGLIAAAAWFILRSALLDLSLFPGPGWIDYQSVGLFLLLGLACRLKPHHPALTILGAALIGMLLFR